MPFPYELYPKAKETHCLNLPEISVSRPPFPGSIRTADGCLWGWRDNNSYVSNSITYNYRVGSTSKAKNYIYGEAFKEKTTRSEGISCNSYANCYIGCSCASGWTQGTAPSSGEYVWATDNRYTGVNSLSVGSGLNASGTIDAQSASSGISASGLSADSGAGISAKSSGSGNYSVSTMGTSGGMTCYKKACPDGYYLDAPNSTYFEYTTSTGTIDLQCYKATGCADGYSSSGTGAGGIYHGTVCKKDECKPSCTDENNCYYGSHTVSDGCGGTCTKCYPACRVGYFYDFSMADCFVRPAVIIRDPGNPNCAKCECDNSDCRYPNGTQCECAYI